MIARVTDSLRAASTVILNAAAALEQLSTVKNANASQSNEDENAAELEVANEVKKVETADEAIDAVQADPTGEGQKENEIEILGNSQAIKLETASKSAGNSLGVVDLTGEEEVTADANVIGGEHNFDDTSQTQTIC